jgi:imidazolonepropionase-like amidohydrolase
LRRRGCVAALATLGAALLALPMVAAADLKALVGGMLVDGGGGPPLADSVILIDGDRITAVGQVGTLAVPAAAEVISTEGLTVLPGLWDLAVRLSRLGHGDVVRWDETYLPLAERVVMPAAAQQLLRSGVTSARDIGSPLEAALSVRERIRAQRIPGPTLYVSGPTLEKDPPARARDYRWGVQGPQEARQKAERLARAGVDCLVVAGASELSDAELAAIAAVARETGVRWHAEVRHDADVAAALAAGAAGLLDFGADLAPALPEAAQTELRARAARDEPAAWVAGVSPLTNYEWLRRNAEPLDDLHWREGLPPIIADDVRASLGSVATLNAFETPALRRAVVGPRLRSARAAGARLLVGSEAGLPGHLQSRATWQEAEALVLDGGLTAAEAIRAATLEAATLMGAEHDNGSVAPGKYADIIAVRGDALRHIERLQDVEIVIRHGLRYR